MVSTYGIPCQPPHRGPDQRPGRGHQRPPRRRGERGCRHAGDGPEQGINYFDLATADSACFPIFGAALAGVRRQVLYQVHFGANYAAGKPYSWTIDLETVKRSVAWQLEQLRTDYIDYGFIHCMDESRRLAPVCGQRRSSSIWRR